MAQWHQQSNGLPGTWILAWALDVLDSSTAVLSVSEGIYYTSDAGNSWTEISLPDSITATTIDISIADKTHIWAATESGFIYATSDAGLNWKKQFENPTLTEFMNYVEMFDLNNGIAMGDGMQLAGPALFLRTTDGGENWISVNDSAFGGYSGDTWRRLDFLSTDTGYFFESGLNPQLLFRTEDGCNSWESIAGLRGVTNLKCFNRDLIIAGGYDCSGPNCIPIIQLSSDGGNHWEIFEVEMGYGNDFEYDPADPSRIYYATSNGLFFSADSGRNWGKLPLPVDEVYGRDLGFANSDNGWLLCDDGFLFHISNAGSVITEIRENSRIQITDIRNFNLYQNYPNPFNPVTKLSYEIPVQDKVKITLFDLRGREIKTIVDEIKLPGRYELTIDGTGLSSGVYMVVMNSGSFTGAVKIILLK
ncbi:MAG: hypothetical protein Kow0098_07110 [Ignavibacteriaceae bacterium]